MIFLRARWYNPADGRFQSRDTWEGDYDSPQSLNRWNYTQSNPINYTDPTGLLPCPWNVGLNACDINDWTVWLFRDLYSAYDINTDMYVPTNSGFTNFAGAVTNEYLKDVKPGAIVIYQVAETGLDFFPMSAYPLSQALSGTTLAGGEIDQDDRLILTFWGIVGLDCFPGVRFAPDGVGGGIPILTGQKHHILTNKIMRALENHPTLKGSFGREDYLVRAATQLDHYGYQLWHIAYDSEAVEWLSKHNTATRDEFISYLRKVYGKKAMRKAFPDALNILK